MATKKKKKQKVHPKAKLPPVAKKTGKPVLAGRPVDNEEPPEQAENEEQEEQQGDLLEIPPQPEPTIQGNRMAVYFIGFRAKRNKNRDRLLTIRLSLELEDAHEGRIPSVIQDEWKHFKRGNVKQVQPEGMETQNVTLSSAPDEDGLEFTAACTKAIISKMTVKGQGSTRKVIRLEIHLTTSDLADISRFCHANNEENCWLHLEDSQTSFDVDGEEEEK